MTHGREKSADNGLFLTANNIVWHKSVVWHEDFFVGTTFNRYKLCRLTSLESCCLIGWQQVP